MNTKLFYNVDINLSESFKNDPTTKNVLGIVNADEGESFGYIISYNSQITPSYNDIKDIVHNETLINITHGELVKLRDDSKLIPGANYKIINYVTTTSQAETTSGSHQFDIIVTAISENQLSENARACKREDDNYFLYDDLSAWDIKYCLDNDTSRFGWASSTGTGVIYYMKDEHNNEAWYDFKNIMFLRSGTWISNNYQNFSRLPQDSTKWVDTYFYTFTSLSNSYVIADDSKATTNGTFHATDNYLGRDTSAVTKLNNTIFIDKPGNGVFNNHIGNGHKNNTFGISVWNNVIEYNFTNNLVCDIFQSNKIGSSFKNNLVSSFVRNIVHDDFQLNTITCPVNKTTFGTAFAHNQINKTHITNISNCIFESDNSYIITSGSTEYSLRNVTFVSSCFVSSSTGNNLTTIKDIHNNFIINEIIKSGAKYVIRNEETNNYIVFNYWDEKEIIDRLTDNIYDLGVVDSSSTAEKQASNANMCTNKDILFIKYTVGNNAGLIMQHVTDGATYQYINWNGFLKYRKITWVILEGNATTTNNPSWTNLFNGANGDLYANGNKLDPTNYVTTNSVQTIDAVKTFTQNIKINEKDIIISDDTVIKGTIDAGEFKVFDNKTQNKGFTIRTVNNKTNDLYPVQILATNNSKSVQYRLPLVDNNLSYLPVNTPINIITEKHIANTNTYGVVKLATVGLDDVTDGGLIKNLETYKDHYIAASTYSISFLYDHIEDINQYHSGVESDIETNITELENNINSAVEEINTISEVSAAALVDLNERIERLTNQYIEVSITGNAVSDKTKVLKQGDTIILIANEGYAITNVTTNTDNCTITQLYSSADGRLMIIKVSNINVTDNNIIGINVVTTEQTISETMYIKGVNSIIPVTIYTNGDNDTEQPNTAQLNPDLIAVDPISSTEYIVSQ